MQPSVITSSAAQKDYLDIQSKHADIVQGITNQKMRVDAYNQQKAAEMQNRNVMQNEIEKAKMENTTAVQKNAMDFAIKQAEIDTKRAALATV